MESKARNSMQFNSQLKSTWMLFLLIVVALAGGYMIYYNYYLSSNVFPFHGHPWTSDLNASYKPRRFYQDTKHVSVSLASKDGHTTPASGNSIKTAFEKETTGNVTKDLSESNHGAIYSRDESTVIYNSGEHCKVDGIESWQNGVVTQIKPTIQRNCTKLFDGSKWEVNHVKSQLVHWKKEKTSMPEMFSMCSRVTRYFSNNFYVSSDEQDFPIAYILVVYTNAEQVVRLLKAIYRPQNLYCIHPDAKQAESFSQVFHMISKCLPNVFVASKLEKVYYGHHTIMDAQLNCMKDLEKYPPDSWKYVINLCGRELPLKTNRQMVSHLREMKGYSVAGIKSLSKHFVTKRFSFKRALNKDGRMVHTRLPLGKPPYNITIMKSMNFIAASRKFVRFLLTNKKAFALRWFLRDVFAPEEHFYSSLYCLPEAPGARPPMSLANKLPVIDKFVWVFTAAQRTQCKSRVVHYICVVSYADLATVYKYSVQPNFFMNKYFMEWDHVAMDCMEEQLVKQNMQEYQEDCT